MDKMPLVEPYAQPKKDIGTYLEGLLKWIQNSIYYKVSKRINWLLDRIVYNTPSSFTDGDTTPSVLRQNIFLTGSTGATSVTDFDDGFSGQIITIIGADSGNTTIVHNAAKINLAGGANFTLADTDTIQLIYDGTDWNEISRSDNT